MQCPYCGEVKSKKSWRPTQWAQNLAITVNFDGCRDCDFLSGPQQIRTAQKVEWRFWYIQHNLFQRRLLEAVSEVHSLEPHQKQSLHDRYHDTPEQVQAGEQITGRVLVIIASEFCSEQRISNLETAASLLESSLQKWLEKGGEDKERLWRPLKEFLDLVHFLQIYRGDALQQIPPGPFYSLFDRP